MTKGMLLTFFVLVIVTTVSARPQGLLGALLGGIDGILHGGHNHNHNNHQNGNRPLNFNPGRPQSSGFAPGGFGNFQPGFGNPFGSGTGSGAGTANVGPDGSISSSGVAISSAQNGGFGSASGHGTASHNFATGQSSGQAGGEGQSQGR